MNIEIAIESLLKYGSKMHLIEKEDVIFTRNSLLELFLIDDYKFPQESVDLSLEQILKFMLDYAVEKEILKTDTITNRDLFDTKIMGLLTPKPSQVIKKFWELYDQSPSKATDYYYNFSQATDYIRKYRIEKDEKWKYKTQYGEIDITINLSKPEKDPKDIALQKNISTKEYPKCLLCKENEGYSGNISLPPRQNHRIIPITLNNENWGLQYSPYVYYNEHSIAFNFKHTPMKIERETFVKLIDFVNIFPHYFIGSNADLPIVGGSILSHDHYQAGKYEFALAKSDFEEVFKVPKLPNVKFGIVNWPMSVLRLEGKNADDIINLSEKILQIWQNYTDETVGIYAYTNETPHNTITPIVRISDGNYQMDLVLRNNITSQEHPFGVFHPHSELHNIKKENIGLIEVMGLAVLPARLKNELDLLKQFVLQNKNFKDDEMLKKHTDWVNTFKSNYTFNKDNIDEIFKNEVGKVFLKVLEDAGVFKRNEIGKKAFIKFVEKVVNS